MRRPSEIIGGVLILIGVMSLFEMLHIHLWGFFWAFALIALGVWFIRGVAVSRQCCDVEDASVALEGAEEADITVAHGAGRLLIASGGTPEKLLSGTFGGGVEVKKSLYGNKLRVELRLKERDPFRVMFPWISGRRVGLDWNLVMNPSVPIALHLETGACESTLRLTDLKISDLSIRTAASSTTVDLPAQALRTRVLVESGAASVKLRVPEHVSAYIRIRAGLSGVLVDTGRFPPSGDGYRSPDYDTAVNSIEISVESGVGSIEVQ
jgi:hypothetical protein